jgi:hypothetical protein
MLGDGSASIHGSQGEGKFILIRARVATTQEGNFALTLLILSSVSKNGYTAPRMFQRYVGNQTPVSFQDSRGSSDRPSKGIGVWVAQTATSLDKSLIVFSYTMRACRLAGE